MRYSRLVLTLVALCMFAVAAAPAFSQVSLNFTGVGGANGGGFYTYPYYFSINNGPQTALICDSFDNSVQIPETWTANVYTLLSAGSSGRGYFTGMQAQYDAAGLIFEAILTGALTSVQGNWAIWGLFSTNAQANSFYTSSGANTVEATYLAMANTDITNHTLPSYLNNMVVYTPVGGVAGSSGPQEYIGVVPEPGTLALFGSGLAFLTGVVRKKLGVRRS